MEPLLGPPEFPAKGFPPKFGICPQVPSEFPEETEFPGAAEEARPRMRPRGWRGVFGVGLRFPRDE